MTFDNFFFPFVMNQHFVVVLRRICIMRRRVDGTLERRHVDECLLHHHLNDFLFKELFVPASLYIHSDGIAVRKREELFHYVLLLYVDFFSCPPACIKQ